MATILVTHGIPAEGFSLLSGEKIVIPKPLMQFSTDELAALIPAADAVVACGALPGEIIRRGRKLRIIAGYGAGYDGVDVRAAAECGIPVTNLPDTVTDSTAELAIGLMLAVSRRIGENSLRAREEAPENLFGMGRSMGRSLRGQMLGLLGCGRIAHLMIKQMSMSSGYSSTSIRERIYFSDRMFGVLFYTGSADKEGSLGGLVELGSAEKITELMRDAFQEALLCTNDPECMHNMPAGKNANGAACHSCCMISETACENGNRMLDRGLVVPIADRESQAYFRELVIDLCQLAM